MIRGRSPGMAEFPVTRRFLTSYPFIVTSGQWLFEKYFWIFGIIRRFAKIINIGGAYDDGDAENFSRHLNNDDPNGNRCLLKKEISKKYGTFFTDAA